MTDKLALTQPEKFELRHYLARKIFAYERCLDRAHRWNEAIRDSECPIAHKASLRAIEALKGEIMLSEWSLYEVLAEEKRAAEWNALSDTDRQWAWEAYVAHEGDPSAETPRASVLMNYYHSLWRISETHKP